MSITHLDISVRNPQNPKKMAVAHFLVDSGAVYSVMPISSLQKLGIKAGDKQKFTLESLGVILDPINRELKPLPMLLMQEHRGFCAF